MLRVTKLADYATLVMSVLASSPRAVLSTADLAARAGIETTTAAKVLKPLAQAGLVESFRGAHGGYRLARDADAISLADIVQALDGPLAMTECSIHDGDCGIAQHCGIRGNWQRINTIIADTLAGISLQSMLSSAVTRPSRRISAHVSEH